MEFLEELSNLQKSAQEFMEKEETKKVLEHFKQGFREFLTSQKSSIENEFRQKIVMEPHIYQHVVFRTYSPAEDYKGMCAFFKSASEMRSFYTELKQMYAYCHVFMKDVPSHKKRQCTCGNCYSVRQYPPSEYYEPCNRIHPPHKICVVFTLQLPKKTNT